MERIVHSGERLQIMEALKHLPVAVEEETEGVPESVLRFKPNEGEWSIKEVAGHLRDGAEIWYERLYTVWSLTDPAFPSFDGDALIRERNYQDADLKQVIAEMREHRLKLVELLARAPDWSRLGQQPGVGRRSLRQFAEALVQAEKEHLEQIRTLKAAQGVTVKP